MAATIVDKRIPMLDLSELYRPEDETVENVYRRYTHDDDPIQRRVRETYYTMHRNQTMEYVNCRISHWTKFDKTEMNVMDALKLLNNLIDESDPDVDLPNIIHAFQTAERIRELHPDHDWFHLTGLIHDLGKVMAFYGEPQWSTVGDTFPVGCSPAASIVYGIESFVGNKDLSNDVYNTKNGIYKNHCGFNSVIMSWGHDEYLYRVLKNHSTCTLPEESLYMIRYHSFYPWHRNGEYEHLASQKDHDMLKWLHEFNKFDLYTKCDTVPDIDKLMPYYQSLIDKYIPGMIKW